MAASPRGKSTDGPVSRYLNRRVSTRITRFIVEHGLPVTPNQVSVATFLLSVVAAVLVAWGHLLIGGLLVQVSSILDGVDGELARATGRASRRGGFLDTMLDRYADILVLAATALAAYQASQDAFTVLLVSLLAVTGDLMVSYLHARGVMDLGVHPATVGPLDSLASRDVRLLLLALLLMVSAPLYALAAVGLLGHVYVVVKFAYMLSRAG